MAIMGDLPFVTFCEESKLPLVLTTKQDPNIRSLLNFLFIQAIIEVPEVDAPLPLC